jgi:hypothetical protein
MDDLFHLPGTRSHDPAVETWFAGGDPLRALVEPWFARARNSGADVTEILHDGNPTLCVGTAAFAHVAAFTTHAAVGFFHGASLDDPAGLLEGSGRRMRHVKLRWDRQPDSDALGNLVAAAYRDIRKRLGEA